MNVEICDKSFGPCVSNRSPFEPLPVSDIERHLVCLERRRLEFQPILPLEAVDFERPVEAAGRGLAGSLLRHICEELRPVVVDLERDVPDSQDAGHEDSSALQTHWNVACLAQNLILCATREGSTESQRRRR